MPQTQRMCLSFINGISDIYQRIQNKLVKLFEDDFAKAVVDFESNMKHVKKTYGISNFTLKMKPMEEAIDLTGYEIVEYNRVSHI